MVDELFVSLGLGKHEWLEDIKRGISFILGDKTFLVAKYPSKRGAPLHLWILPPPLDQLLGHQSRFSDGYCGVLTI